MSNVGADCYAKLKMQLKSETPANADYDAVIRAATTVYKQQLTIIGLRNKFMNRLRRPSESVA